MWKLSGENSLDGLLLFSWAPKFIDKTRQYLFRSYITWYIDCFRIAGFGRGVPDPAFLLLFHDHPASRHSTLEIRKKLGRVSFRKDFWDCYWGRASLSRHSAIG